MQTNAPANGTDTLLGIIDQYADGGLTGWVMDRCHPEHRCAVTLYIDDVKITEDVADVFRHDLLSSGLGDGGYAFNLDVPLEVFDGRSHVVEILITGPADSRRLRRVMAFNRSAWRPGSHARRVQLIRIGWIRQLFHAEYYRSQLSDSLHADKDPLVHYLLTGDASPISPHPLFDATHYLECNPDVAQENLNPLLHYLLNGHIETWRRFHPLFDIAHYNEQIKNNKLKAKNDGMSQKNLLLHYILFGAKNDFSPSPFFDPCFFQSMNVDIDFDQIDPFSAFLLSESEKCRPFHPAFQEEHYSRFFAGRRLDPNPLKDLLAREPEERGPAQPFVDPAPCPANHMDILWHDLCPVLHVMAYGRHEPHRRVNRFLSDRYMYEQCPEQSFINQTPLVHYMTWRRGRPRLVFIGHEASRTGAPLILLKIMAEVAATNRYDCFLLLNAGGPLVEAYSRYAHVLVAPEHEDRAALVHYVRDRLADEDPVAVIANSAESHPIAGPFGEAGIPVYSLIHETPEAYSGELLQWIAAYSTRVILPSTYLRGWFYEKVPDSPVPVEVRPQGLLDPTFGRRDRTTARSAVRRELGLPNETVIVLGCGTVDRRKGVDLFVSAAIRLLTTEPNENVVFVWLGKIGHEQFDTPLYWARYEVSKFRLEDRIRFIGERTNPEPYFLAADVFVLSSRADPFPCVVHEAMAARLPIVAFADAGGAPEALAEGAGVIVPYGDVSALTVTIHRLIESPQERDRVGATAARRVAETYQFRRYARGLLNTVVQDQRLLAPSAVPATPRMSNGKVIFSTPGWNISGVNTFTRHLAEGLLRANFDVELLLTLGRLGPQEQPRDLPACPHRFLQPSSKDPRDVWDEIGRYLRAQAPCVYVPNYDHVASAVTSDLPDDIAVVGIAHADDVEYYEPIYRLGLYWNRIVAVSDAVAEGIRGLNPLLFDRTVTIPYGVPVAAPVCRAPRPPDTPLRLVYAGRFDERQKRISDYVRLVHALERAGVSFHLTLIGDGEAFETIRARLAPFIGTGRVTLPGFLPPGDIRAHLEDADIFLLLSNFEGLPLSLLEAMERGAVPVVYETKSGVSQLVREKETGFLRPIGDVDGIARAIQTLAKDRVSLAKVANRARQILVEDGYTVDAMTARYGALFDVVLAETRDGTFKRPAALTYASKIGNVLPPPMLFR